MLGKQAWVVLLLALTIAFGSFTVSLVISTASRTATCEAVKSLATVEHEKVKEEKQETAKFERQSPDRLGLTPEQFNELTTNKQHAEEHRAEQYTLIAHRAC